MSRRNVNPRSAERLSLRRGRPHDPHATHATYDPYDPYDPLVRLRPLGGVDHQNVDRARAGSSLSPSCSCTAVKIEGAPESGAPSGAHVG